MGSEMCIRDRKISDNLWQEEDIKQEEIPEGLQEEIRESGAIAVALKDVRPKH